MMWERDVQVDHSSIRRWASRFLPFLEKSVSQTRAPVGDSWRLGLGFKSFRGTAAILASIELLPMIRKAPEGAARLSGTFICPSVVRVGRAILSSVRDRNLSPTEMRSSAVSDTTNKHHQHPVPVIALLLASRFVCVPS